MSELTLTIKCSNADKATVTIDSTATVLDLKHKIAEQLSVPAAQQRLIYKGRVLKDESTLDHYEIQNEHTVLLHIPRGQSSNAIVPSCIEQHNGDAPAFETHRFIASKQTQVFFYFSFVKEGQHHFAFHASVRNEERLLKGFYTGPRRTRTAYNAVRRGMKHAQFL